MGKFRNEGHLAEQWCISFSDWPADGPHDHQKSEQTISAGPEESEENVRGIIINY